MDMNSLQALLNSKKKELVKNEKPYTAKIGDNRIVILPGWGQPERFWREFGSHFVKDPSGKTIGFYPCDDVIHSKPCPVCAALAEVARATNDPAVLDAVKKARASMQFLINVIVVGEFNNEPQVMSLSKTAFEQLLNLIGSWGASIFDPVNPQVVSITRTGTGFDTKYMVNVAPEHFQLPSGVLSKMKNLDEYVNQRTDSMMNKCLQAIESITGPHKLLTSATVIEHNPNQIAYEDLPTTGTDYTAQAQPAYVQPVPQPAQPTSPQPYAQAAYVPPQQTSYQQPVPQPAPMQAPSLQGQPSMNQEIANMLASIG